MYKDTKHRFWSKVQIGGIKDCWIWGGGRIKSGYGIMNRTSKNESHPTVVSRYVLWLYMSGVSENLEVGHKCGNKNCVNPYHLYLTSREENNREHMFRDEYYYPVLFNKEQTDAIRKDGLLCQSGLPEIEMKIAMPDIMICGHSTQYVVSSNDGTHYCVMCAYQSEHIVYKKTRKLYEELFGDD